MSVIGLKGITIYRASILVISTLVLVAGCRSIPLSPNANADWVRDLDRADLVVLRKGDVEQELFDRDSISRFSEIYANSKFEVYWHTLPSNLGERSIDFYSNGIKIRQLSYAFVLWEHNPNDSDRTASLSDADQDWIESLFESMLIGDSGISR